MSRAWRVAGRAGRRVAARGVGAVGARCWLSTQRIARRILAFDACREAAPRQLPVTTLSGAPRAAVSVAGVTGGVTTGISAAMAAGAAARATPATHMTERAARSRFRAQRYKGPPLGPVLRVCRLDGPAEALPLP